MSLTSNNCSGGFELTLFYIMLVMGLLFIVSAFMVFEAGAKEEQKPGWKALPLFWFWPIRPLYTSNGLNHIGKIWRYFYIFSVGTLAVVGTVMYINGYCSANT